MRLYLKLSASKKVVPFNYQTYLTGAIHKWMGADNTLHGATGLFCFSWLQNIVADKNGLYIGNNSYFFVSAHGEDLVKTIIRGIRDDPFVMFGSMVEEVQIVETPAFGENVRFQNASPILIKRRINDEEKHVLFDDPVSGNYLTENFEKKLRAAGLPDDGISITFDVGSSKAKTKLIFYRNIGNKVNLCPIIITGSQEQIAFAWNTGVGNSTGIGFGALK